VDLKRERNSELANSDPTPVGVAFAAVHQHPNDAKSKSDDERMSLFWRVFGGTILSIAALVAVTIFNNLSGTISELRSEISRINEARGELIKKDEFNSRITTVYERAQALQTQNNTQNGSLNALQSSVAELKDRLATLKGESDLAKKEFAGSIDTAKKETGLSLDAIRKDQAAINDGLKKDVAAIDLLKDRLTAIDTLKKELETLRKDLTVVEGLKERLTVVTTEIKDHRDDMTKLRQDVDRNHASDAERKKSRDDQYAKLLETMKELDKSMRSASEKIARLEGTMTPMNPTLPVKTIPTKADSKSANGD
jgi:chromosome segregation ATPase